jgi:SAM-dependent methyltransferase
MHPDSMRLMRQMQAKHFPHIGAGHMVCDDGGLASNPAKSYRHLLPVGTMYTACDIVEHPSVQVVKPDPFTLPFDLQTFDLVLSGQMLEHCQNPFRAVAEMKRVLKVGGIIAIIVPSQGRRHDAQDGWRFMDDAFRFIAAEVGGFDTLEDFIDKAGTEEGRGKHWRDHVWVARRIA